MAKSNKVIITCAVTGAIHTPSMSPHLPVTPEEIADAAIGAAEAGAAIVHLHARNPETGKPDQTPEAFQPFLKVIKQRTDCVINLTTGGAPYMTVEERLRPAAELKPEVASLNMGSMNFGLYPMLNRFKDFKFEWERAAPGEQPRPRVQEHLRGYRIRPEDLLGERHPVRVRVLRHLAPVQSRPFPRPRAGQGAAVRPDRVRPARRHRAASGRRDAHEADGGPAVRRRLPLVGAGRRAQPDADRRDGGRHGRQCPRRAGRQPVGRSGQAGGEQRGAGPPRALDPGRAGAGNRHRRPKPARSSTSRAAIRSGSDRARPLPGRSLLRLGGLFLMALAFFFSARSSTFSRTFSVGCLSGSTSIVTGAVPSSIMSSFLAAPFDTSSTRPSA